MGTTIENRAVVQTPSGLFAIDTAGRIEAGSTVTFSTVAAAPAAVTVSATNLKPSSLGPPIPVGLKTTAVVSGPPVLATTAAMAPSLPLEPFASGTQVAVTILGRAVPQVGVEGPQAPGGVPFAAEQPSTVVRENAQPARAAPALGAGAITAKAQAVAAETGQQPTVRPGATQATPQVTSEPNLASQTPQRIDSIEVKSDPLPPLTGLVVGHSVSGQAVVQTPIGLLTIEGLEAVPRDTAIQIDVRPQLAAPPSQPAPSTPQMTPQSTLLTFGQEWQTVKDIVTVVAATDAAAAQQFVNNSAPAMNNRLASTVLFYFVACKAVFRGRGSETRPQMHWNGPVDET